jgi:AraC-like DNA-binding protein
MLLLDTDTVAVADRVDAFNTAMLSACVPKTITHEQPARPIEARMELWDLGAAHLFTSENTGFRLTRTRRHVNMEGEPYVALGLQTRGEARFEQSGHQQRLAPGDLLLNDLTAVYDVRWSGMGGSQSFQVGYDRLGLPPDLVRKAAPNLRSSPLHDLVRHHLRYIRAEAVRLQDDPGLAALGTATVELVRALIVSAAGDDTLARPVRNDTMLARVFAYARRHLTDPDLTPGRIAAVHNISLRQLYTLLREADISLEQWIIAQRLEGARADLTNAAGRHRTIAAVARSWGFAQASHFSRRFHAAYGITPREWQRLHLAADVSGGSSEGHGQRRRSGRRE